MAVFLFFVWLLFNGHFAWDLNMLEISLVGLFAAGLIYLFACVCMDYRPKYDWYLIRNTGLLLACAGILVWEVLKANAAVIRIILGHEHQIQPMIVTVRVPLRRTFSRTLLANYITLTPGTITVDQNGDYFTVHCLDDSMLGDYEHCPFVKLLRRMEQK